MAIVAVSGATPNGARLNEDDGVGVAVYAGVVEVGEVAAVLVSGAVDKGDFLVGSLVRGAVDAAVVSSETGALLEAAVPGATLEE